MREGNKYKDEDAATYLLGSSLKKPLDGSPFVRYLNYGQGKDGYWTYKHMILQIEDCGDCLTYLYPDHDYEFELDHSSGHNAERPDGLSTSSTVLNLGWGGKQRKMRSSLLTKEDVGNIEHDRALKAGKIQTMVFRDESLPPIFDPDAPKYDSLSPGTLVTRKFTSKELREMLEKNGLNSDGLVAVLRARATWLTYLSLRRKVK